MVPQRPRTTTVVDLDDLSPPPMTPSGPSVYNYLQDTPPVRRPTTSIVQFKDLDDKPDGPHRVDGEAPDMEESPISPQRSHQQTVNLSGTVDNGEETESSSNEGYIQNGVESPVISPRAHQQAVKTLSCPDSEERHTDQSMVTIYQGTQHPSPERKVKVTFI